MRTASLGVDNSCALLTHSQEIGPMLGVVRVATNSLGIKGQEKNGVETKFWSRLNFIARQQAYKGKTHKPNWTWQMT